MQTDQQQLVLFSQHWH